jgi:hypothetical protein
LLVLGSFVAVLPARWAAAEEPVVPVPCVATPATDDEQPAGAPRRLRRTTAEPDGDLWPPPPPPFDPLTIEGASFYEVVGRPDLAAAYRARQGWAVASRVLGGLSLGIGAVAWVAVRVAEATLSVPFCALGDMAACQPARDTLWVPDIMMAGGLALLILPAFWSNDPVSDAEKAELVRTALARARPARAVSLSFAPVLGGEGGTLSLSGRF